MGRGTAGHPEVAKMGGMKWHTLVSAGDLAARLRDPGLRLFDCRFDLAQPQAGRQRYAEAHLPEAAFADLNVDLSSSPTLTSGRHPLPEAETFAAWLRSQGVDPGSQVVAYDDHNGMFAARLWWMLRWLGHDLVAVLDGGLRRWRDLGLPLTADVPRPRAGSFTARPRPQYAVDAATVQRAAADPAQRVLDARAPERYRGDVEPIDAVGGHVPGARNHPVAENVGPDGLFLPAETLRVKLLASLGGVEPQRAIAMCGSGVTACHVLLAMERAGLPGARLYPGSWSEWSRDPARPVAKGPAP
jgi:thiosulfate/3-mercaptopyruvate sulfurtransferase